MSTHISSADRKMAPPAYQPFYCEENIWRLCRDGRVPLEHAEVWVVTNREKFCPVWRQRLAPSPEQPVVWDYHVVCVTSAPGGNVLLWDLDAIEPCSPAREAVMTQFGPGLGLPPRWRPCFRVMPARTYLQELTSDRRHMRDPHGNWLQPPPPWDPPGPGHNLDQFLDLDLEEPGQWMSLDEILQRLTVDS